MSFFIPALIFYLLLLFLSFNLGTFFSINPKEQPVAQLIVRGFILSIALFHVLATPFIIFHWNSSLLFGGVGAAYLLIILLNIYKRQCYLKASLQNYAKSFSSFSKLTKYLLVFCCIIVFFQAFTSSYLVREDADDSYYVALTTQSINDIALYQNSPYTRDKVSSQGAYTTMSWQVYISFWCKISGIPSTVMSHTYLPLILIVFCYLGFYLLSLSLFQSKQSRLTFLLFTALIFLFGGFSGYTKSMFLLGRIWQGKALFINLLIPILFIELSNFYRSKSPLRESIYLAAICLAGISLSPIALFLIPMFYFCVSFRALFESSIRSKIIFAVLSIAPIAIYAIIFYIYNIASVSSISGVLISDADVSIDFNRVLRNFFTKPYFLLISFTAIPIAIVRRNINAIVLFAITPAVIFIFFLNPFAAEYIAKYITHPAVYWRICWLIPYEFALAYVFTELLTMSRFKSITSTQRNFLTCFCILGITFFIVSTGSYTYQKDSGFLPFSNIHKIPSNIIKHADIINQQSNKSYPLVLAPGAEMGNTYAVKMRQYSDNFRLFFGRHRSVNEAVDTSKYYSKNDVYTIYSDTTHLEVDKLSKSIKLYDIDWIIYPESGWANNLILNSGYAVQDIDSGYVLYKQVK